MQSNQGVVRLNGDSTHHSPYKHNEAAQKPVQWREPPTEKSLPNSHNPRTADSATKSNGVAGVGAAGLADFFSPEVFQIVLHNPTTSHQLLKFSQSRFCGENMEFLDKVDRYNTLLDELTKVMSDIHRQFTSVDAPRQLNLSQGMMKRINADIKSSTLSTLPAMELIFADAQEYVEKLLATDIYPRFVKHQMTTSAVKALSSDRGRYAGLGDCFCLTDPAKADNPIISASDGFIKVTGYSRTDIIPRNCRFLQGKYTDVAAVKRLKASIDSKQESVELLLNYRKNGEPFWNLLYVAPLYAADGRVAFYLGGQINCSTTIHNCSDILRVLSISDEPEEEKAPLSPPPLTRDNSTGPRGFFKSFRARSSTKVTADVREAGMEQGLLNRIENMNLKTQMKMFYTAYSKYLVLSYDTFTIEFYSPDILDMLIINPKAGTPFVGSDIFRTLAQHSPFMSKDFKNRIKESLRMGRAISSEINLSTRRSAAMRGNEKFATHWTPLKDEHGAVKWVVLTLGSMTMIW